ncbi:MAG: ABC transporter ATP-binding protein [Armatimonadota bacterium]|nr:ABC transporter ATP-binding protein [Armatimonadota bacterium]MDR7443918.1 ABC transporter ATP-binding protein [Armatimonadota bacterium]MDR7570424.1 ABC transporter ATP-binding protein [Armatimonadota bacterium]MDR7613223.1 ABC transporter ATP-binding protein [Armatimonadota bacterium]
MLRVEDLRLYFRTSQGPVQAVDGVCFELRRGRTLVVAGESGCGKSSLARAILRLLPRNVHTYSGRVYLDGLELLQMPEERFRREVRWRRVSLVPQAAQNALNPVLRVGDQVAEPLLLHGLAGKATEARPLVEEAFRLVGLPLDFVDRYPFELSGGMRQRVALAQALVLRPDLVILDEPTSALDVLTQAALLNVLKTIKWELGTSFLFITHDLATASELADEVVLMYAGQVVERCSASQFFTAPLHPYARALLGSVPTLRGDRPLAPIPGRPPSLIRPPAGCRFADRCPARFDRCAVDPPGFWVDGDRWVKCWLWEGSRGG